MPTIKMPQLGESVTEGTIERWLVKEGDSVEQYDPLFEVVTDKVNAEVPSDVAGTITKIMVPDGETVAVGTALAEIDAEGGAAQPAEAEAEAPAEDAQPAEAAQQPPDEAQAPQAEPEPVAAAATQPPAQAAETTGAAAAAAPSEPPTDASVRMTPAVRRLVREHDIDISRLNGSGAGGRVTRDDVLAYIEGDRPEQPEQPAAPPPAPAQPAPAAAQAAGAPQATTQAAPAQAAPSYAPPTPTPAPTGGDQEAPLSQMRKGIAAKMTRV